MRRRRLTPELKREFFSLPNILTYGRIAAIPFVIFVLMISDESVTGSVATSQWLCFVAFIMFAAAAVTDYFDGYLARTRNMSTLVGKFIDPVADKLIVLATLISLVDLHRVAAWIVVLILLREMSINALRTLALAERLPTINVVKAGKWKTAFQLCGILGLILHYEYKLPLLADPVDFNAAGQALIVVSLLFSFISAGSYFKGFVEAIKLKYSEEYEDDE
jgi:CDP-diacylglycerol--glycerol-3-phosphate 3-phosphatidyltransferase